jgi:hypothetical protein
MESDIIAEGFSLSEKMYSLRYMSIIGDSDSSVMAKIRQAVSYGIFVTTIECANHACKAYRSRLETVAKDNPQFRGRGGLTKKVNQRLTVGAKVATAKHSKTGNVTQLRHDLRNGPSHVFGDHSQCSPEFCTYQPSSAITDDCDGDTSDDQPIPARSNAHSLPEQIDAILDDLQVKQASQDDEQDAARGGLPSTIRDLPHGLFNTVSRCCDCIISLVPQLIANQTSNLAECYMSIRGLFDGGNLSTSTEYNGAPSNIVAMPLVLPFSMVQHGPYRYGKQPPTHRQVVCYSNAQCQKHNIKTRTTGEKTLSNTGYNVKVLGPPLQPPLIRTMARSLSRMIFHQPSLHRSAKNSTKEKLSCPLRERTTLSLTLDNKQMTVCGISKGACE